jgi:hypothetical protein
MSHITPHELDLYRAQVLHELDELQCCFDAIANLLAPEPAMDGKHRDHISTLMHRLSQEQATLLEQLRHPELHI